MRIRFGDCVFDDESRLVTRANKPVELSPKAFALLGALLSKRPRAVKRQDLQDVLWPKTYVGETSLARVVSELRQALGDAGAKGDLIRTVHGFGYAFCAKVAPDAAPHSLDFPCSLLLGAREIPLAEGENLIGRTPECVVRIGSPRVSRRHARILVARGHASIEDLGSKNGTAVCGQRIAGAVVLREGDEIAIGPLVLIYRDSAGAGSTKSATRSREGKNR
jgi:DNA-binding winged helix-turn-helix (wHTH) protein